MRPLGTLVAAFVVLGTVACGPDTAATVGSHAIPMSELRREIETMLANPRYVDHLERGSGIDLAGEGALKALAAQVLTVQISAFIADTELQRRGVRITAADRTKGADEASAATGLPSIIAAFPAWYRDTLVDRATTRVVLRRALIADVTAETYYRDHKADYVKPCVRDIVVATEDDALEARGRITAGTSFAAVARDVSLDKGSAPKGGDLGCNGIHDLLPALNDAVRAQPIGNVGDPIEADGRWHLVLVESRDQAPLGRVQGEVEGAIQKLGKDRLEKLVVDRLRESDVTVASGVGAWDGTKVVPR